MRLASRVIIVLLAFPMLLSGQKKNPFHGGPAESFDQYISASLPLWKTPGISVVVVKDGQQVFKKGYGIREIGKDGPFSPTTLSACASTTKAMTAVCLAMLVDEGKLKWTDKVAELLPGFKLSDPYASAEITVKDLLTHNTGLGNGDLLWVFGYSRAEILRRMGQMPPAYSFRSSFIYQNLMYIVAGELIAHVSGMSWENFISSRIFRPLGMSRTFADHSQITAESDKATPHFRDKDRIRPIEYLNGDNIGPAGGVWSCAEDMAKWIQCLLDSTRTGSSRLLSPAGYASIFNPAVLAPINEYPALKVIRPHWFTYGLGWFQLDYRGTMLQFHTGSLEGLTAIAGLVPDRNFGIYIYGNLDHAEIRHALMYKAIDLWCFKDNGNDWSDRMLPVYKGLEDSAKSREAQNAQKRILHTNPSRPLEAYCGNYSNPIIGSLKVGEQNNSLFIELPDSSRMTLDHWHFDTFKGHDSHWWIDPGFITFQLSGEGGISGLSFSGVGFDKQE